MPFTVIRGRYQVVNYSPDGDSIRFEADDSALFQQLDGPPAEINARNHVQLRIEAIDALETHFTPPSGGGTYHQPLKLAQAARDDLLAFVGITDVEWDSAERTVLSAKDGKRSYILSRAVEKNRRPIALVFTGNPPKKDGSAVHLDAALLKKSYNYSSLQKGLTYATYYQGLFKDLRETMTAAAAAARAAKRGVYKIDATNAGITATSLRVVTKDKAIMPKLFRRVVEYMVNYGTAVGFKDKLEQSQEPVLDLIEANFTHFDTFIDQADGSAKIRMTRKPEELVFDAMPTRPLSLTFSGLMGDSVKQPSRIEVH
jgi:hypothetical protein